MSGTLNLYWKVGERTKTIIEKKFSTERKFEEYLFYNQDMLGDVYIIERQIRTGADKGIPDMLGVDQEGRICIIELKNIEVTENILPQVLGYAIWAETNPDSIKSIWLESSNKPEEIEIDWDDIEVRIIIVSPSFNRTIPMMTGKIGFPIDLIQVRRFCHQEDEFILVEVIEDETKSKPKTTKVLVNWDWDYYQQEHGIRATRKFKSAVQGIDKAVNKYNWNVLYNLTKTYASFKLGNRVVFSVNWAANNSYTVGILLPEDLAQNQNFLDWEIYRYDKNIKFLRVIPLDPANPNIKELERLFEEAIDYLVGD